MKTALVGHTGFVGGNLARQDSFDVLFNRQNLTELRGQRFDRLVCAALPAVKWMANREPESDRTNLQRLCDALATVEVERFVLISTVDVYPRTTGVDEDFDCGAEKNHAYGVHRLELERFVQRRFPRAHVVRLPALFGTGLKKNVIYDLLHGKNLEVINPTSRFQWYPLCRLARDLALVEAQDLRVVNLVAEPMATHAIVERFFPQLAVGRNPGVRGDYDLRTKHAALWGGTDGYMMGAGSVMEHLGDYLAQAA